MRRDIKILLGHIERSLARRPSPETLDRLALLAGFQDWEQFRRELHGSGPDEPSGAETKA